MRTWGVLACALVLGACSSAPSSDAGDAGDAADVPNARWTCPAGWVATVRGGCGPALLLCGSTGGAAAGACDGIDLTTPPGAGTADGGAPGFYRLPDGAIGGPWSADDSVAAAPTREFAPAAGIPSCAPGWTRLATGTCDPALPTDCGPDAVGTPGAACAPGRASECAAGEWVDVASESGAATVVRVRAGASDSSADGSAARPFGTLAAALDRAGDGGWVLLAAGSYVSNVTVTRGAHVVGVCAARVVLSADAATPAFVARGAGAALEVRGLTVRPAGGGIAIESGARATLRGVAVVGAQDYGVQCSGAASALDAQQVRIAGARRPAVTDPAQPMGFGIHCRDGARCDVARSVVSDCGFGGIRARDSGTRATVVDTIIETTHAAGSSPYSVGLASRYGAALEARRCVLRNNADWAATASEAGSTLTLEDSVLRGDPTHPTGPFGLQSAFGGVATVARTSFEDMHWLALSSTQAGAQLRVSDSVIRNNQLWEPYGTAGCQVAAGARAELSRVLMDSNTGNGLLVDGIDSTATLSDSVIRDTGAGASGLHGVGVVASGGSTARAARSVIASSVNHGVFAHDPGSQIDLDHVVIRETTAGVLAGSGHALLAATGARIRCDHCGLYDNVTGSIAAVGASVELYDTVVDGARSFGVASINEASTTAVRVQVSAAGLAAVRGEDPGTSLTLADCALLGPGRNTMPAYGRGIEATYGASIAATGVLIQGAQEFAAQAYRDGAVLSLRDSLVVASVPSARGFGLGVVVFGNSHVAMERVAVDGASGAAVASLPDDTDGETFNGGTLDVTDAFLRGTRSSTVQYSASGMTVVPAGRVVAYGLHVGTANAVSASNVTILGGGYGFYASSGMLALRRGLIAEQLDAVGAFSGIPARLEGVALVDNATDGVLETSALPEGASLPPPDPVCGTSGCQ